MIKSYLTDRIVLVAVTHNEWGVITETELPEERARVEDINKLILDGDGKEVVGDMRIFLKDDSSIDYGYKIKIKKKNGIAFDQPDKQFQIKKISKLGMFKRRFIQVIV